MKISKSSLPTFSDVTPEAIEKASNTIDACNKDQLFEALIIFSNIFAIHLEGRNSDGIPDVKKMDDPRFPGLITLVMARALDWAEQELAKDPSQNETNHSFH